MSFQKVSVLLICALLLGSCGKEDAGDDQYGADAAVIAGKDHGLSVLTKRLRENLRLENGVVIVDGPIVSGAATVSRNSPWSASCGDGIAINVGKGEIDLIANSVQIDDAKCASLTKQLGMQVQAIVDGRN